MTSADYYPPPETTPAEIREQRDAGWPDIHPEDFCHRCGQRNPQWYVDTRAAWLAGTTAYATATGREGILCPTCFVELWSDAHGPGWIMRTQMEPLRNSARRAEQ